MAGPLPQSQEKKKTWGFTTLQNKNSKSKKKNKNAKKLENAKLKFPEFGQSFLNLKFT